MDAPTVYLVIALCHCVISVALGKLGLTPWPAFFTASALVIGVAALVQFGGF